MYPPAKAGGFTAPSRILNTLNSSRLALGLPFDGWLTSPAASIVSERIRFAQLLSEQPSVQIGGDPKRRASQGLDRRSSVKVSVLDDSSENPNCTGQLQATGSGYLAARSLVNEKETGIFPGGQQYSFTLPGIETLKGILSTLPTPCSDAPDAEPVWGSLNPVAHCLWALGRAQFAANCLRNENVSV